MIALTPKRLIAYLNKNYDDNYRIDENTAKKVLEKCNTEYDGEFTEDELIGVVEEFIFI